MITLAMALGRYHVRRFGCEGLKGGWRRAKPLDNFRHKAPQVQEALFLDDPDRSKVCMADLKSFLTCDEDGTIESRYSGTKMLRNQMSAHVVPPPSYPSTPEDNLDVVVLCLQLALNLPGVVVVISSIQNVEYGPRLFHHHHSTLRSWLMMQKLANKIPWKRSMKSRRV